MSSAAAQLTCSALSSDRAMCESFGGLRVWAPSDTVYRNGLEEIRIGIEVALSQHPSLDKPGLLHVLAELIGEGLDKQVIGAILGGELRLGHVEEVLCAAPSNKIFRVYLGQSVCGQFYDRVRAATDLLREKRHLKIRELRDQYFTSARGMWMKASHLVAHMVFRGTAVYIDKHKVAWPTGLENAFR